MGQKKLAEILKTQGNLREAAYYFDSFDPEAMRCVFEKGMNDYNNHNRVTAIKQQASIFNWQKTAQQYLDIYRQLA